MDCLQNCVCFSLKDNPDSLDFMTMLNVLGDVANGVNYLHTGQTPSLIHCDIKRFFIGGNT